MLMLHRARLSQKPVSCSLHCILRLIVEHSKVHLSCNGRQLLGSPEPCERTRCLCAGLCESLAPPLATFGIGLSLVEPGPVSTPFMENIPKNAEKAAAAGEEAKGELDEVT